MACQIGRFRVRRTLTSKGPTEPESNSMISKENLGTISIDSSSARNSSSFGANFISSSGRMDQREPFCAVDMLPSEQ
eukprot:2156763-Rhodomonas_salina.8